MTYHIGMHIPPAQSRGLCFDREIEPTWLVGRVRPGVEYLIRDKVQSFGVRAFFPGKTVTRHRFGKPFDKEKATVTGYVFMRFEHLPDVEAIRQRVPGFWGFATANGVLIRVTQDQIAALGGLTDAEAALEAEKRNAMRVRVGDTARLLEGALEGFTVEVLSIHNGEAIIALAMGGKVKASLASLGRVVPDGV